MAGVCLRLVEVSANAASRAPVQFGNINPNYPSYPTLLMNLLSEQSVGGLGYLCEPGGVQATVRLLMFSRRSNRVLDVLMPKIMLQAAGIDAVLQRWPVSKRVNSSKAPKDDETLTQPVDVDAPQLQV